MTTESFSKVTSGSAGVANAAYGGAVIGGIAADNLAAISSAALILSQLVRISRNAGELMKFSAKTLKWKFQNPEADLALFKIEGLSIA